MSAEEQKPEENQSEKKSGSKGTIVVGAVLALVLGAGGYAYATGMVSLNAEAQETEPKEPAIVLNEEPTFLPMEKFVVGLSEERSRNYMVVELSLVSHDPRLEDQAKSMDPILRNAFLEHFAGKGVSVARQEAANPKKLQAELRQRFINAAEKYGKELALEEVLLTNVLIQ